MRGKNGKAYTRTVLAAVPLLLALGCGATGARAEEPAPAAGPGSFRRSRSCAPTGRGTTGRSSGRNSSSTDAATGTGCAASPRSSTAGLEICREGIFAEVRPWLTLDPEEEDDRTYGVEISLDVTF
jgi:hypothetical protein